MKKRIVYKSIKKVKIQNGKITPPTVFRQADSDEKSNKTKLLKIKK